MILNEEPPEMSGDYSKELRSFIEKTLTKIPKNRPSAIDLCLSIPNSIVNNYTLPKITSAASTSFMNPTKSAVSRQKSTSKRKLAVESYIINTSIETIKTEEK
jgi:serine/threonine protein kinase